MMREGFALNLIGSIVLHSVLSDLEMHRCVPSVRFISGTTNFSNLQPNLL